MMRGLLAGVLSILIGTLAACSREAGEPTAIAAPANAPAADEPLARASGEDPDAAARRAGYLSAAQQARARHYWNAGTRAAYEARAAGAAAESEELARR